MNLEPQNPPQLILPIMPNHLVNHSMAIVLAHDAINVWNLLGRTPSQLAGDIENQRHKTQQIARSNGELRDRLAALEAELERRQTTEPIDADPHPGHPTNDTMTPPDLPVEPRDLLHDLAVLLSDGTPRTINQISVLLPNRQRAAIARAMRQLRESGSVKRVFTPGAPDFEYQITPQHDHDTADALPAREGEEEK
jgi:hypothetical protein